MQIYDAIIIGAGPAGGQCARELSQKGFKVFLAEKAKSFLDNNYSSGGAPIEIMRDFNLPDSIVGTFWNKLAIYSTSQKSAWESDQNKPFGAILDFDKLRSFLSKETMKNGSDFRLNSQYLSHQVYSSHIEVKFNDCSKCSRVLVDATGTDRKVFGIKSTNPIIFTGIEHHIEVNSNIYQTFCNSLNFYLGHKWMPQGYAWIFPMGNNQLKVGVIRYFQNKKFTPYEPSYQYYLNQMLSQCGDDLKLLDRHGKTIQYSKSQNDKRYEGPLIAIGDAISGINPLGCEGIRHAMVSGREASKYIEQFLTGKIVTFKPYGKAMNRYFGFKWKVSEFMTKSLFTTQKDKLIDLIVKHFGLMNNNQIMDVIFHYRFSRTIKSYFWYFISRLFS